MGLCSRIAVAAALLAASAAGAQRIDLNGQWQFQVPGGPVELVNVPHTWNVGKHAEYEGTARYWRDFDAPQGKRVELHFGATFYKARVTVNGVAVGEHEGGYTAWWVDITPHLKPRNRVEVEINNQPGEATIPGFGMLGSGGGNIWYDWWHYGGIVRDVWLTVNEPVLVRRQQIRTKVAGMAADVTSRVFLENYSSAPADVRLRATAWAPGTDTVAAKTEQTVRLGPGKQEASVALRIDPVALWHFDHPQVYRMEVELLGAKGELLDALVDNFGARTVEIRDAKIYLNGEPVRLTGMTRHADSPWEGLAETAGTMKHDYDEMKELGVTLSRPVHYPQHPYVLDYCDRNGILLIPEIPMWQFSEKQMSDPRVRALAARMLTEMIEEAYNHPSIFAWSVFNESAAYTPGGRSHFEAMYEVVKKLDPDRYVSYADDRIGRGSDPKTNSAAVADFIMMNQYYGSWHGQESELGPSLERMHKDYPGKLIIISEFGFAGTFAPDKASADAARARILREQLDILGKYDFVGGAIFWCYQDYKSHKNQRPGYRSGYVEMGLVDENRQRYPSFDAWKKRNEPARIKLEWLLTGSEPGGFRATITPRPETEIPHYTLRGYEAKWEVRDTDGRLLAAGQKVVPEGQQTVEVPQFPSGSRGLQLTVRLFRPNGFIAATETLAWWNPRAGGYSVDDMKKDGLPLR